MDIIEQRKSIFSNKVTDYIKFRPDYPREIISFLEEKTNFSNASLVADIGAGTGKLTKVFLDNGNRVFSVEPNTDMREASINLFSDYENFQAIEGTGENTNLNELSIDLITCGQSFHWFEVELAKKEFKRILKNKNNPNTVLIWNKKVKVDAMKAYTEFLSEYATETIYASKGNNYDLLAINLFGENNYEKKVLTNMQYLDLEGLKGRYLSTSYALPEKSPKYAEALKKLDEIYNKFNKNGILEMAYNTEIYLGKL